MQKETDNVVILFPKKATPKDNLSNFLDLTKENLSAWSDGLTQMNESCAAAVEHLDARLDIFSVCQEALSCGDIEQMEQARKLLIASRAEGPIFSGKSRPGKEVSSYKKRDVVGVTSVRRPVE